MSTTLTIPDLEEPVAQKLRLQAASHGRTVEAEAREILIIAVTVKEQGSVPEPTPPVAPTGMERNKFEQMMGDWERRTQDEAASPQERMRQALDSLTGIWVGRGTTDELMRTTRGED